MKWEEKPDVAVAAELRERRAEFWRAVWPVATGVFIGQVVFSGVAYVVVTTWLDSVL